MLYFDAISISVTKKTSLLLLIKINNENNITCEIKKFEIVTFVRSDPI